MKRILTIALSLVLLGSLAQAQNAAPASAGAIRIDAGAEKDYTSADGTVWQADRGYTGGETVNRGDIAVANTKDEALFRTERYGMDKCEFKVPNGADPVNFYLAESSFTTAGQRVFDADINGWTIPGIDIFAETKATNAARVKSALVGVTGGTPTIAFSASANHANLDALKIVSAPGNTPPAKVTAPVKPAYKPAAKSAVTAPPPLHVYYVSPTGNDANPGTEKLPWRTIGKAAATLVAGDTVYIGEGTYHEQVIPQNSGAKGRPITYAAWPGQRPVIDGTGVQMKGVAEPMIFQIVRKAYITVEGLRLQNVPGYGLGAAASSYITFRNNSIYNTVCSGIIAGEWLGRNDHFIIDGNEVEKACTSMPQECISVARTEYFEVTNNHVHNAGWARGGEGIDVKYGSSHGIIANNYVHDLVRQGIYVDAWSEPTHDIDVYDNVVQNCSGNDGLDCCSEQGGLLENIRFYRNISFNNGGNGFRVTFWGYGAVRNLTVRENLFFNNGLGSWGTRGGISVENSHIDGLVIRNNVCLQNKQFQISVNVPCNNLTVEHNLLDGYRGATYRDTSLGAEVTGNVILKKNGFREGFGEIQGLDPVLAAIQVTPPKVIDMKSTFRERVKAIVGDDPRVAAVLFSPAVTGEKPYKKYGSPSVERK